MHHGESTMAPARRASASRPRRMAWLGMAAGLLPCVCHAHVEASADGFMSGLLHPVTGVDHFLAMLSVGIVSAQLGGRHIFTVPGTFVLAMTCGAAAGLLGYGLPHLEAGIALSVILLSMAIVVIRGSRFLYPIMGAVALFGFLHGYAHGLEMPKASDPVFYAGGFLVSTIAIHLLGVAVGYGLTRSVNLERMLRHVGSTMSGMGVMLLLHLMTGT